MQKKETVEDFEPTRCTGHTAALKGYHSSPKGLSQAIRGGGKIQFSVFFGGFRGPEEFQGVGGGCGYILTKFQPKRTHQTLVHTIFHDFGAFVRCFSYIPIWEWDQWTGRRARDQWTGPRARDRWTGPRARDQGPGPRARDQGPRPRAPRAQGPKGAPKALTGPKRNFSHWFASVCFTG